MIGRSLNIKSLSLLLLLSLTHVSVAQEDIKDEYSFDFARVYDADTIYYYGYDFSNFGLANPEKVGQEESIKKFFVAWMHDIHEIYKKSDLEVLLKTEVKKDLQLVQDRYKLIRDEWITFEPHRFDTEKIKEIVKEYELNRTSGIGFVMIVENFNKEKEHVRVNYTFFDIATREVLWSVESKGEAMGAGMTNHWSKGLEDAFTPFKIAYNDARRAEKKSRK